MTDHDVAARLATEAGNLLLDVRTELADATGAERKAAGDKRSHDFLMEALAVERPGDAVLSEEGADDPVRLSSERVWIIDPLDGTREFSELGREDWAVHVALWQAGELVAGAVALPAQGITLATPTVNPPPATADRPRIVVSRTRPPAIALAVREALDGTREFSELGRDDWAVHVALWQEGELVAGAVALPAQGITLATPTATPPPATAEKPRIVVSRTRPPAVALAVRDALDGTLVEMGSAGAKVASVVQGISDIYVHAGGQYEWDSAAPVAVARAAGLHTSRIDGSPLVYNQADPRLPDLVVCRPEFADAVLAITR